MHEQFICYLTGFREFKISDSESVLLCNVVLYNHFIACGQIEWRFPINSCPAEPRYTLPLQTV